ncbi:MAG: peptide chain release factor 1 [Deltaproteobacteria bacterium]|nr:peptide chain release factor 1 [Deltaproteobacteria bacterium]
MFEKLDSIQKKFAALNEQLSSPAVLGDVARYKEVTKEHASLKPLIEAYNRYQHVTANLKNARDMLAHEPDADLRAMAQDEIAALEPQVELLEKELRLLLLPPDPRDEKNILLEIRAGTGGEEAALFAADLFRMYMRFAETKGWKVEILEQSGTGLGGIKEVIALISGERVYSWLKYERGVHRVQRVPKTEASGRIHTSAVTVAAMPEAEDIDIQIDEKDLRIDVYRASGPGGQGVNRTDSAVRITHLPTNTVVACQDERSQHKNKARAMKILKSRILDQQEEKQAAERTAERRAQVGSGDRSEKIRTYNFPQNRITDHRIGLTIHNLAAVMEGDLEEMIMALRTHTQAEALKTND